MPLSACVTSALLHCFVTLPHHVVICTEGGQGGVVRGGGAGRRPQPARLLLPRPQEAACQTGEANCGGGGAVVVL